MRSKINILFIAIIAFCSSTQIFAQSDGISPLSSIGLGDFYDTNFIPVALGGGLAAAYHDPFVVNIANPASLGHLTATAFDFGVSGQFNTLSEGGEKQTIRSGNLSYISLALPLVNPINELLENKSRKFRWGAQIALMPYTNVSYNITNAEFNPDIGTVRTNFTGDGNTYKLLMNHGLKKGNTSFGLGIGLLLGGISFDQTVSLPDQEGSSTALIGNEYSVSGFLWNLGVQHDILFKKKNSEEQRISRIPKLTIGLTAHSSNSFNTTTALQSISISPSGLRNVVESSESKGSGKLPAEFNLGFNYESGDKWTGGANIYYGNWASYFNEGSTSISGAQQDPLSNAYRINVGGSYLPNRNSIRNLFARSKYKFGVFYGSDPREFNNEQLKIYGINAGVELAFLAPRNFSFVNIGMEYGRSDLEVLGNSYIKINLGLTFNSNQWFLKRKYN